MIMMRLPTAPLLAALAATGLLSAAPADGRPRPAPVASDGPILVMPFENPSSNGRIFWLREGAAVLLSEDLRAAGANAIERDERVRAFERLGVPLSASLSDATVIKVAELLGAATVVVGTLALEGDQLVVTARSIRIDAGRLQATASERAALPDLARAFDRLLARLFPAIRPLPDHNEKTHAPLPAFEDFIKGLLAETPAGRVKFLQAALTARPEYDAAQLALWQVSSQQGEHAKALAGALRVAAKSPAFRRARFLAAWSQVQLKQYDAALTTLRALADQEPSATVFNNLGVAQLRKGGAGQGAAGSYYFYKAQELDPGDSDYSFNLGYAYFLEHDQLAAAHWLREAVRRNPADGDAHYVLGAALVATNASTEGAREKELAHRLSSAYADWDKRPAGDPIPRGLERLKDDLQPTPVARGQLAYQATEQKDQQDLARFHLDRGRRFHEQENDREATAELRRAIYLSPYDADAHLLLGRIHLRNGRLREAIDALKISLWSRESAAAHAALGEAWLQSKDPVAARAEAQRALALDPLSPEAKALLGKLDKAPRDGV
jgi:tetratricopeptide (TPR) repeat protein